MPRVGAIAGCYVRHGTITRGSKVRFLRDGVIIWKGSITSLKRFKDDAREVHEGFECGIGLSNNQDLRQGDLIETFEEREIPGPEPHQEPVMHIASLTLELHLPAAHSLKEKRSVFARSSKGLAGGLGGGGRGRPRGRWQLATVGMAAVSGSAADDQDVLDAVERFVWSFPEIEVTASSRSCMSDEDGWGRERAAKAGSRGRRRGGRRHSGGARGYPRLARVNEVLREVLGGEPSNAWRTRRALRPAHRSRPCNCDPTCGTPWCFSPRGEAEEARCRGSRARLQAAVSSQVRLKRTPLRFAADPAVASVSVWRTSSRHLPPPAPEDDDPPAGEDSAG